MYVRTTNLGTSSRMLNQLMVNQSDLVDTQIQLANQKRVSKPSDDAVDASQILQIGKQQDKIKTYLSNITTSREQVNTLDGALASITNVIQRANELTIQAANGTYSASQLKDMKTEIGQIKASIVDFANTQYNGQYIFSGNNTSSPAYTIASDGSVVYNGSSGTDDSQRSMEIMEGVYVPLNVVGSDIFGSYKAEVPEDPGPPVVPAVPASGSGIFKALSDLEVELNKTPADCTAISGLIGDVQDGLNTVSNTRTQYGSYSSKRLDMTESYLNDLSLSLTEQRSGLEDLDVVKAITDLNNKNYAYQASLQTTAQNMQMSLLNYI